MGGGVRERWRRGGKERREGEEGGREGRRGGIEEEGIFCVGDEFYCCVCWSYICLQFVVCVGDDVSVVVDMCFVSVLVMFLLLYW